MEYSILQQNQELLRRVEKLEKSVNFLQKRNEELYKVLSTKHSFLEFEFAKDEEKIKEEKRIRRERGIIAAESLMRRTLRSEVGRSRP
jgi:hypothetical protein